MMDYLRSSIQSLDDTDPKSECYIGISLWTFINEPIGLYSAEGWNYYPYKLSKKELLELAGSR
jgi:hypothetical protein